MFTLSRNSRNKIYSRSSGYYQRPTVRQHNKTPLTFAFACNVPERNFQYIASRDEVSMHVLVVRVLLPTLLFTFRATRSSAIHSRSNIRDVKTNVSTSPGSNKTHNVTVDCGDATVMANTVEQCQRDLFQLSLCGYPWSPQCRQRKSRNNPNATDRDNTLRDALDSLNHVCGIQGRSRTCLEESGIQGYCLATSLYQYMQMDFQFICHHQQRDENLIHSLQCLRDRRFLAMLYIHIADRCQGMGILDNIMRRYKHAYFYTLNIIPAVDQALIPLLYCLPKSVISTCIRHMVEDLCGTMAAVFVQNYLLYIQNYFDQAMESAGIDPNICHNNINSEDVLPSSPLIPSGYIRLGISRLLEITAPGTALDTVHGRYILAYLHGLSGEELCATGNAYVAYEACVMSSDDTSVKSKFNVLQFAHGTIPLLYHGTQCGRLEQFTACWNVLQEVCGHTVRGFEQHATLLVESCKIQSEMEIAGCHWQDMLLEYYIQASRVTVWPLGSQCLANPLYLNGVHYGSFDGVMDDLDTVITLLQPGVEDISRRCGPQSAKRLRVLLNKLRYLQRDASKYTILFRKSFMPNN